MRYTVRLLRKIIQQIETIYNYIDDIWSTDWVDLSDCKILNSIFFGYIFVIIDNSSNYTWCVPLKNKNDQTIIDDF